MRIYAILLWLLICALPERAQAHQASQSYLHVSVAAAQFKGQWDIAVRDLDLVLALDANGDGKLPWEEVQPREAEISRYAFEHLKFKTADKACVAVPGRMRRSTHSDGDYVALPFTGHCAQEIARLQISYLFLNGIASDHRGLLNLSADGKTFTQALGEDNLIANFDLGHAVRWDQFRTYLLTGVEHIWTGYDHLLFLLSLLLPAVLRRNRQHWQPQPDLRAPLIEVVKVVTAFTVAHSLTLAMAAFGILRLPSRLTESAIALSVVAAALNNIVAILPSRRWTVALVFGLIHGFGFASALGGLDLPPVSLALALFGFNLGVEAGQLVIVAVFLPCAFLLRRTWLYQRYVLVGGSALAVIIACLWFIERAFDLSFLPVH